MKKKFSVIVSIIGSICLVTGSGLLIVNQANQEKEFANIKNSIVNDYENFKVKIESFSEERTNIYENLNKISYLTELPANYDNLISEYSKYEQTLNEIENASKDLKINCFEYKFVETDINNKVSAFTINYEQAVNYYIQDVEKFNEKVRSYNEWIQNTQLTSGKVLEEYQSSYKDYVDVNGDGIYNGVNK